MLTESTSPLRSRVRLSLPRSAAPLVALCAGLALSLAPASLANIGGAKCPPPPSSNEATPAFNVVPAVASSATSSDIAERNEPAIRIAICLDTSGSMDGLLNQARTKLWDVVNFLSTAKYRGTTPTFQVALFQYGSDQLPSSEGYMRCVQPFTTDLDLLSERLFSLTIAGSSEYCGQVMSKAANELAWQDVSSLPRSSRTAPAYSTIVIAGNEEFTQGPIDYQPIAKQLKNRRIYLNTIYCGSYAEGERTGWLNAAYLNGGAYLNIDQDRREEYIPCPQDGRLSELNGELNSTYLAYTVAGRENKARQEMQDSANAAASREAYYQRAASKSSAAYRNETWDILDALDKGTVKLEDIPSDQLPEKMRPMTLDERRAYVAELKARRAAIQAEIRRLNEEREAFLRDRRKRPADGKPTTLDSALIKSIREQAQKLGFTFSRD